MSTHPISQDSQHLQDLDRAMAVVESFRSGARAGAPSNAAEGPAWTQYDAPWNPDVLAGLAECRRGFEQVTWVEMVHPELAQACNKARLLADELFSRGRLSNLRKLQVDARIEEVWNPVDKFAFFGIDFGAFELAARLDCLAAGAVDLETLRRTYRYVATGSPLERRASAARPCA